MKLTVRCNQLIASAVALLKFPSDQLRWMCIDHVVMLSCMWFLFVA